MIQEAVRMILAKQQQQRKRKDANKKAKDKAKDNANDKDKEKNKDSDNDDTMSDCTHLWNIQKNWMTNRSKVNDWMCSFEFAL